MSIFTPATTTPQLRMTLPVSVRLLRTYGILPSREHAQSVSGQNVSGPNVPEPKNIGHKTYAQQNILEANKFTLRYGRIYRCVFLYPKKFLKLLFDRLALLIA